jgi:hypothetical protein
MTRQERRAIRALVELDYSASRIARELKLPLVEVAPIVAAEVRKARELQGALIDKLEELELLSRD